MFPLDASLLRLEPEQQAEVQRFAAMLATEADPGNGEAMASWQRDRAHLQAVLDGASLAATAAFESSLVWAADGARSAGAWLASNTSCTRVAANVRLKTARLARSMDHVSAAARSGALSAEKVHDLTRARTPETEDEFDRDEAKLVREVIPLQVEAARVHLLAWRIRTLEEAGRNEPDGPAPTPRTEQDRINLSIGFGGRGLIDGELTPESMAIVAGAVGAEIDRMHRDGQLAGDDRTRAELHGKALVALIHRGSEAMDQHGAPRPLVIAIADTGSLSDRDPADAEEAMARRSEIVGFGPVPTETVRRLLCNADVCRVVTDGQGQPIDVGRTERLFTARQWRAMIVSAGGVCEFTGCGTPHERCQAHHIQPWEHGGPTDLANGMLVCNHHHHLLHEGRFSARRSRAGIEVRRPDGTVVHVELRRAA
ncbi:HNH endonuclease signature motif containing protein [soil metagenome]